LLNRAPILIVEDEALIALELQLSVMDAGGDVVGPVGSASAALSLLRLRVVAAAILDVHLRDRDVTPVAEALVALKVPMVFHTAESLPPHLRLGCPGAIVYQKPVATEMLLKTLAEMIRR
jgi:DNA-binding response OmpR family regulator